MPKVSVVVPVYRGAATVGRLVELLGGALRPLCELEIVLVDDGSPDNSAEVMAQLAAEHPWVVAVFLARNFGEHNAILAGLNHASGDVVVTMDDDLQNPPEEVWKLIEELGRGYDVVYSRYEQKNHHWARNLGSWFNDRAANVMLGKPTGLYLSSFRVMSRWLVDEVRKYNGPFPYVDGLILRATRNIGVITVRHDEREVGQSGYTVSKLVKLWANMFTNFSILPLRIATLLGLGVAGVGVLLVFAFIYERLRDPTLPVGWASLIVAVFLLAGVQLFALGAVGEYLGRLFLQVAGEPQFVVRSTKNGGALPPPRSSKTGAESGPTGA